MAREKLTPSSSGFENELKSLKKEIKNLEQALAEQKQALLETQRSTADFMIVSTVSTLNLGMQDNMEVQNKLGVIASNYRIQLRSSETPLEVFQRFYADCVDLANEQGIETVNG